MHLKALRPQRWADVSTLITKSDDFDTTSMSAEELERQIADIEHKSRVQSGLGEWAQQGSMMSLLRPPS